jgi:hypothetical protein
MGSLRESMTGETTMREVVEKEMGRSGCGRGAEPGHPAVAALDGTAD